MFSHYLIIESDLETSLSMESMGGGSVSVCLCIFMYACDHHTFKCTTCVLPGCIHSPVIPQPGCSKLMSSSNVQNREKCFGQ